VRPLRRRRQYTLPLASVAQHIIYTVVRYEIAERKRMKRAKRKAR